MKIIIKKNEGSFKFETVELRVFTAGDMLAAERLAGENPNDVHSSAALLSIIGTFDGRKVVMEDILNMELSDFLELQEGCKGLISAELAKRLFGSSKKAGSVTKR